ncbi:MAG: DUF2393 family protein [Terriglobales bacterium]
MEPSPVPRESISRPVILGIGLVIVVVAIIALLLRTSPKPPPPPQPYIANIKISGLKMGEAQNFVGANFTYIDGTVTNTGDKSVTHISVHVVFHDSMGQVTQAEDVPVFLLDRSGPYPDTRDLSKAPLLPEQSKEFRLTFEHVSAEWNRAYPDIRVTDVSLK